MNYLRKGSYAVLFGVFLVLVTSTVFAWWIAKRVVTSKVDAIFMEQVTTIDSWISNRMELYKTVIYGFQGYWGGNVSVSQEEWARYARSLKIEERYQGITSITYAKRVGDNYILTYIYPEERAHAIGFDLASEQSRLAAINKSINENSVGISDRVLLAADQSSGFVMVAPLYSFSDLSNSPDESLREVDGVVAIAFKSESVFKDIFGYTDPFPSLDFELYKGQDLKDDSILYDHDQAYYIRKGDDQRRLETKRSIFVNGERLTLLVASKPNFRLSRAERNLPVFILVSGLIVSTSILALFLQKFGKVKNNK
jgi:CHASE1-domain containing sensor protein